MPLWIGSREFLLKCTFSSALKTDYEYFAGNKKSGSADMIPMDELGPGKLEFACLKKKC